MHGVVNVNIAVVTFTTATGSECPMIRAFIVRARTNLDTADTMDGPETTIITPLARDKQHF